MVTVNDQLSIRLSTLITIENYKQIQFVTANSHVLKRLVSTVRFCPSAPLRTGMIKPFSQNRSLPPPFHKCSQRSCSVRPAT